MNSWQFEILFTLGFLMQLLVKTWWCWYCSVKVKA